MEIEMCDKRNIVRVVTEVTSKPNPSQKERSVTTESPDVCSQYTNKSKEIKSLVIFKQSGKLWD